VKYGTFFVITGRPFNQMVFFPFFLICIHHITVDLGSQYIKSAESSVSGRPNIHLDPSNNVFVPSAAALRNEQIVLEYKKGNGFESFSPRFGSQAVAILKRKPHLGVEFLPRTIGRSNSSFDRSKVFSPSELLALYLQDYAKGFGVSPQFTFIVPFYWTRVQKKALSDICSQAGVGIENVIDDLTSMASHYSSTLYSRFVNKSRNVLFVDVGATSVKTYGFVFQNMDDSIVVNETVNGWNELTGGYFFAEAVSKAKGISMKKAYKILSSPGVETYADLLNSSLTTLKNTIREAAQTMESYIENQVAQKNSRVIDEIQIIGGATKYKFVYEAIKEATNCTKIFRDFDPIEGIAIGGVYSSIMIDGMSVVPPCQVHRKPFSSISVTCGQTHKYCQKGAICRELITESGSKGCEYIGITADPRHIPEGVDTMITEYKLLNISKLRNDEDSDYTGYIYMSPPSPIVSYVQWCKNVTCYPIAFQVMEYDLFGERKQKDFIIDYFAELKELKLHRSQYEKTIMIIKSLSDAIQKAEQEHPGSIEKFPEDAKIAFSKYIHEVEEGKLAERSTESLRGVYSHVRELAASMLHKTQPTPAPTPIDTEL